MNLYIIIYFITLFLIIYLWFLTKNNYKNMSWQYYLIFSFFWALWFLFYFIFYALNNLIYFLLFLIISFYLSIISLYFFIKFINSIWLSQKKYLLNKYEIVVLIILWYIYLFTDLIIKWIYYNDNTLVFYEDYWNIIYLH